jgi:Ulp1 family protease
MRTVVFVRWISRKTRLRCGLSCIKSATSRCPHVVAVGHTKQDLLATNKGPTVILVSHNSLVSSRNANNRRKSVRLQGTGFAQADSAGYLQASLRINKSSCSVCIFRDLHRIPSTHFGAAAAEGRNKDLAFPDSCATGRKKDMAIAQA